MIEVLVHCYLYIRKIYPNGIFKKSIKYGSPVYTSIYPPLNAYIKDILNGARHLNKTKRLHKLEIQLYKDDEDESTRKLITLETFVLDDIAKQYFDIENDEYLFDFEEVCRVGLLELSEKAKNLGPLPVGTKFRICVQTTQSAFVKMCNESKLQVVVFFCHAHTLKLMSR